MRTIYILLLLIISTTSFSQINTAEKPHIDVTGKAELEVSPDEIYIDICLQERIEKGKKITLGELENSLKRELQLINIPSKNLSISDINSIISKTGWWTKEILSVGKYSLKIAGAQKLKQAFKIFKKLKITEASITKATHSRLAEYRKKNRINAIKAAKEKADYLLNAINAKTGKPIKVTEIEQNHQNFAQINYVGNSNSYNSNISKIKSYRNETVQFENIKLVSTIHVIFEIK